MSDFEFEDVPRVSFGRHYGFSRVWGGLTVGLLFGAKLNFVHKVRCSLHLHLGPFWVCFELWRDADAGPVGRLKS